MKKKAAEQYIPRWRGSVEGYVTNQITKQLWRFSLTHDRDDLTQEAYIVFLKCERAYPVLDTPQHFMSLYMSALQRRFNDLSRKHSRIAPVSVQEDTEGNAHREQTGALDNDGYLAAMIRQAPREVSMVLALFLNAPAELLDVAERAWAGRRDRKDANAMIRRLLGPDAGNAPIEQVEAYFQRD